MDKVKTFPVKLVIGLIFAEQDIAETTIKHLQKVFGKADLQSLVYPFDMTDYYAPEMGPDLLRRFCSFRDLIDPSELPEIKRLSIMIEKHFSYEGKRRVNLDPGYLDMDKFILASTKYGRQKIYIADGIYADPTLHFFNKTFHAYEWSFPDFRCGRYDEYFMKIRNHYKQQRKE